MTEDPCTPLAERAAILEYLAGLPRDVAEARARAQIEEARRRREAPPQLSLASTWTRPQR